MVNKSWLEIQNNNAAKKAYLVALKANDLDKAEQIERANPKVDWASVKTLVELEEYRTRHNILNDNVEPPETV